MSHMNSTRDRSGRFLFVCLYDVHVHTQLATQPLQLVCPNWIRNRNNKIMRKQTKEFLMHAKDKSTKSCRATINAPICMHETTERNVQSTLNLYRVHAIWINVYESFIFLPCSYQEFLIYSTFSRPERERDSAETASCTQMNTYALTRGEKKKYSNWPMNDRIKWIVY